MVSNQTLSYIKFFTKYELIYSTCWWWSQFALSNKLLKRLLQKFQSTENKNIPHDFSIFIIYNNYKWNIMLMNTF